MSRWRRFLANPYKLHVLKALLAGNHRQKRARRHLKNLTPATLDQVLRSSGSSVSYLRERRHPAFYFDFANIPKIIDAIPDNQRQRTIKRAKRQAVEKIFRFRGSKPVIFLEEFDWWYAIDRDLDWNRDLHRLDWLVDALLASYYTGEERYAAAAGQAICHWWQTNPPGTRPWSEPFEVAQRANTLSWLLFLGLRSPFFPAAALECTLCAILASGIWLETTLEFQTPNNHLLIEIIRLYQLSILLPEYPAAAQWQQLSVNLLAQEVERQVLSDGFHCELSVFYHRLVLEALLEMIALAHRNNMSLPETIPARTAQMVLTLSRLRRPDGTYPLLGDGFQSDILLRYDLEAVGATLLGNGYSGGGPNERTIWLLNGVWPQTNASRPSAAHFWPQAGYAVLNRPYRGGLNRLIFDCGDFGLAAAPGHGHADCLGITLDLADRPILIDPGTYSFQDLHWRQGFRGTRAHNTMVIDSCDQTYIPGLFGAGRFARPRLNSAILSGGLRFFDASHDGYQRCGGSVQHRRLLLDLPDMGWLVIDLVTGQGRHEVEELWHFHPDILLRIKSSQIAACIGDREVCQIYQRSSFETLSMVGCGIYDPPLGWLAEEAGQKIPAPVLISSGTGNLPLLVATLFVPGRTKKKISLQLKELAGSWALEAKIGANSGIALFSPDNAAVLDYPPWSATGRVLVCQQTPDCEAMMFSGGTDVSRKNSLTLSLPRESSGLLVNREKGGITIYGDVPLPLELFCPIELPVAINGEAVAARFDRRRRMLQVSG